MKTTPQPCRDVTVVVPELRSDMKTTVRLHPRRGSVAELGASKIGGRFLWPENEPWPYCEEHGIPYVGVAQLAKDDVPEIGFRPRTDLFQLLWCPRDHDPLCIPKHLILWRSAKRVRKVLTRIPRPKLKSEDTDHDGGCYLLKPCRLHPERVEEYPDFNELAGKVRRRLKKWDLSSAEDIADALEDAGPFEPGEWLYRSELSVAPGSKVGGHVEWIQYPEIPTCRCRRKMDHLLTISTLEPFGERRWCPLEDRRRSANLDYEELLNLGHVTDLELGDGGSIYYFICRNCKDWPVEAVFQCG